MEWFDDIIKKAEGRLSASEEEALKKGGKKALEEIKESKEDILGLGKDVFFDFLGLSARGRPSDAVNKYVGFDIESLLEEAEGSAERIGKTHREAVEKAERAERVMKKMSGTAARFLFPLLMGLI